jgi:hypothetical protein
MMRESRKSAGEQSYFFYGRTKLVGPNNDTSVPVISGFTPLEPMWPVTFFFSSQHFY